MLATPSADLDNLAVRLAADIARAEAEVVCAVLADHPRLVPVAELEGITSGSFAQDDLRLVWIACDVGRNHPLITVLKLARRGLRDAGFWDRKGPVSRGTCCLWSDESLALVAQWYPASETAVRVNARHLLSLSRRWAMAESWLRQFRDVLSGSDIIVAPTRPTKNIIVNAAPRGKRGVA